MVSPRTIEIVKQTVPILQEHGEILTRHFYRRMFEGNPEVKAYFNPAHQQSGTQQRALAGAICAYAQNIENPALLGDAVELIAQKHASLGIRPEHYPIVGKHLLGSIREVLGEAATEEVIDAWAEAYQALAEIFIQREGAIYEEHEKTHGWTGFESFRVRHKVRESDIITSFYLEAENDRLAHLNLPGQYLTVRVPLPEGGTTMRNYSISSSPDDSFCRISVKKEPAPNDDAPVGYVSHYLHHDVAEGETIEVGPPCGAFALDEEAPLERPLVLISGGVGITPCLSMLRYALKNQKGRAIFFIHGALNSRTHAFGDELRQLARQHPNLQLHVRYNEPHEGDLEQDRCDSAGWIDDDLVRSLVPSADAEFYYCGPKPFMVMVHKALKDWGVPDKQLHHEFFGPAETLQP